MLIGVGLDGRLGLDLGELEVVGREAAGLGFESMWTPATGVPDSFHICGQWGEASAEETGSPIRTGISVVPAPRSWHPVSLAVQAATVSLRTNGTFVLGIGTGGAGPEHFAAAGFPNRPIAVMRDYLHVLRGLLHGETVNYEGPALNIKNTSIGADFAPVPVYLAALGPQMLRVVTPKTSWCRCTSESASMKTSTQRAQRSRCKCSITRWHAQGLTPASRTAGSSAVWASTRSCESSRPVVTVERRWMNSQRRSLTSYCSPSATSGRQKVPRQHTRGCQRD